MSWFRRRRAEEEGACEFSRERRGRCTSYFCHAQRNCFGTMTDTTVFSVAISPWFGSFFFVRCLVAKPGREQPMDVVLVFAGEAAPDPSVREALLPPGRWFRVQGPVKHARLVTVGGGAASGSSSSSGSNVTVFKTYKTTTLVPIGPLPLLQGSAAVTGTVVAFEAEIARVLLREPVVVLELQAESQLGRRMKLLLSHYPRAAETIARSSLGPGDRVRLDNVHPIVMMSTADDNRQLLGFCACAYSTVTRLACAAAADETQQEPAQVHQRTAGLARLWTSLYDAPTTWMLMCTARDLGIPVGDIASQDECTAVPIRRSPQKRLSSVEAYIVEWNAVVLRYVELMSAGQVLVKQTATPRDFNTEFYGHVESAQSCWVCRSPNEQPYRFVPHPVADLAALGLLPSLVQWFQGLANPCAGHRCAWTSRPLTKPLVGQLICDEASTKLVWRDAEAPLYVNLTSPTEPLFCREGSIRTQRPWVVVTQATLLAEAFAPSPRDPWVGRWCLLANASAINWLHSPSSSSIAEPMAERALRERIGVTELIDSTDRSCRSSTSNKIAVAVELLGRIVSIEMREPTPTRREKALAFALVVQDIEHADSITVYADDQGIAGGWWPNTVVILPITVRATCTTRHLPVEIHCEATSGAVATVRFEDGNLASPLLLAARTLNAKHSASSLAQLLDAQTVPTSAFSVSGAQGCQIVEATFTIVCGLCRSSWNQTTGRCTRNCFLASGRLPQCLRVSVEAVIEDGTTSATIMCTGDHNLSSSTYEATPILSLLSLCDGPVLTGIVTSARTSRDSQFTINFRAALTSTEILSIARRIANSPLVRRRHDFVCTVKSRFKGPFAAATNSYGIMDQVLLMHPTRKQLRLLAVSWTRTSSLGRITTLMRQ